MTREEAKKILEAYIACESKKAHFECSEYNCGDDCPLLYDMGTVGEYNEAIDMAIQALEQEPCEDCISRQAVLDCLTATGLKKYDFILNARNKIKSLPSVKPQTVRCKDCKWWKDSDGFYHRGVHAESKCPINRREVFEGNGYCYMYEPKERSDKG